MTDQHPVDETPDGLDRRSLLKRGAVVGGALVWTTPVVQSIASPAFAQTSPGPGPQGCPGATTLAGFKVDGGGIAGFNRNQCVPAGGEAPPQGNPNGGTPFVAPVSASFTATTLTFTLAVNDTLRGVCVVAGQGRQAAAITPTLVSSTPNANGTTTFIYQTPAGSQAISNFGVLFNNCPTP